MRAVIFERFYQEKAYNILDKFYVRYSIIVLNTIEEVVMFGQMPSALTESVSSISDFSFRQLNQHIFVLFDDENAFKGASSVGFEYQDGDNALLLYGYIDHEAGISFEALCFARAEDGSIDFRPGREDASCKLRYDSINGSLLRLTDEDIDAENHDFISKIAMVNKFYKANPVAEKLREIVSLDPSRSPQFPDDILVIFIKEGYNPEGIWGRIAGFDGEYVTVQILNGPWGDFGLSEGDLVPIELVPVEDEVKAVAVI